MTTMTALVGIGATVVIVGVGAHSTSLTLTPLDMHSSGGGSYVSQWVAPSGAPRRTDPIVIPHQEGDRLLLEIPRRTLETDLLVTCRVDADTHAGAHVGAHSLSPSLLRSICPVDTTTGVSEGVSDSTVVETRSYWHLTQLGNTVFVQLPNAQHVPIVRTGADSAPIIDVTPLLPHSAVGSASIVRTTLHPHGIVVELAPHIGAERVTVMWTLLQLPNRAIPTGRVAYVDSVPVGQGGIRRLEKRDPWAASSEVVTPIVYTLDPAIPARWIRFVRRGLEEWNPVFDSLGFQHVIRVRELDGPDRMARWQALLKGPHDVVVWDTSNHEHEENVLGGGTMVDENTRSDAVIEHAPISLAGQWTVESWAPNYLTASPLVFDSLVQHQPAGWDAHCPAHCSIPDSLVGLVLQGIAAHEMGHALGLEHNFLGRLAYPTDSLRHASFLGRMGYTPTVMDYTNYDYVAQPEDHLPAPDLIKSVGPYDRWAIALLYRPIPGAYTLADEIPTLQQWNAAQDTALYLRGSRDADLNQPLIGANAVQAADAHLYLLADLTTRFGAPGKRWPREFWQTWMKEAGGTRDFAGDSAHVVPLVQFYLTHLALRHDPVLQAVGMTAGDTSVVSIGGNHQAWEDAANHLLTKVLDVVDELLISHPAPNVQAGVCHFVHTVRDTLTRQRRMSSRSAIEHTDSLCAHAAAVVSNDRRPLPAASTPTSPTPIADGDGAPILTAVVMARMGMVQARLTRLPDSIRTIGLTAAETTLVVHVVRDTTVTGLAMERLAARYPAVAVVLRQSGLTAQQWMTYQTAIFQVCWALQLGLADSLPPASALGQSVAYGYGHRHPFFSLIATGMALPFPRSDAEADQAQTKMFQKMLGGATP